MFFFSYFKNKPGLFSCKSFWFLRFTKMRIYLFHHWNLRSSERWLKYYSEICIYLGWSGIEPPNITLVYIGRKIMLVSIVIFIDAVSIRQCGGLPRIEGAEQAGRILKFLKIDLAVFEYKAVQTLTLTPQYNQRNTIPRSFTVNAFTEL